jgi:adenosylhomocysteine nucleosidase
LTTPVVGVVCALQAEARHLGPGVRRAPSVASLADGTLLTICGMGGAAAALGARNLLEAGAGALVSWGMAGGLDPALAAGRIFLPSEVAAIDGAAIATSRHWREQLSAALAPYHPLTAGRLLTTSGAIESVAAKAALFQDTGAAAVDMESLAVAQVARAQGAPFIAIRVIVDGAGDTLPSAVSEAADADGQLRVGRLIARTLRAPAEAISLLRLTRRYLAANRSLAAVARSGYLAPQAPTPAAHGGGARGTSVS